MPPDSIDESASYATAIISTKYPCGVTNTFNLVCWTCDQNRDWFGVSVCTVDGQRFDIGDVDSAFSIQSCVSPLAYAVAVEDIGIAKVHQHVGVTPSGLGFDDMSLNSDNLPHNPLVSAVTTLMLISAKPKYYII